MPPRRSARIQEQGQDSLAGALTESKSEPRPLPHQLEHETSPVTDASSPERPPAKRRKVLDENKTEEPQPDEAPPVDAPLAQQDTLQSTKQADRRVRGRRGLLKLMAEMPVDTLHEIFRQLEPVDLLHLSWANKSLNSIIMEKAARYIWEEAYEREYQSEKPPPRCPDDLNLAQYTRFLFKTKCMVCGSTRGYYTSWMMRIRACWSCLTTSGQFRRTHGCSYLLEIEAKKSSFCFAKDKERLESSFGNVPLEEGRQRKILQSKGTSQFETWQNSQLNTRKEELNQLRHERKTAIMQKLAELGWTESRILEITDGDVSGRLPGFTRAKRLTERDWTKLQTKLLEEVQTLHDKRLAFEMARGVNSRWSQFEERFSEWAKSIGNDHWLQPKASDIAVLEPFKTAIFTPSTETSIELEIGEIDRSSKVWVNSRIQFILGVLPQYMHNIYTDEDNSFKARLDSLSQLAILTFKYIPETTYFYVSLRDICTQRKLYWGSSSGLPEDQPEEVRRGFRCLLDGSGFQKPWDWDYRVLEFDVDAHERVKEVVRDLFGLDPLQATRDQVDACDLSFMCDECALGYSLRGTLAIRHEIQFHLQNNTPITERWRLRDSDDRTGSQWH